MNQWEPDFTGGMQNHFYRVSNLVGQGTEDHGHVRGDL